MEGTFRVVWGINFWEGRITEHLLGDRYFVRPEKHTVKVVLQSFDVSTEGVYDLFVRHGERQLERGQRWVRSGVGNVVEDSARRAPSCCC